MKSKPTRTSPAEDPYLTPYRDVIRDRLAKTDAMATRLTRGLASLAEFACAHEYYGLHRCDDGWVFREWAPNATALRLVGDFSKWASTDAFALTRISANGVWECRLPPDAIAHGQYYRLEMCWEGGRGERIPAYARRVVQDPETNLFAAQVWLPEQPYVWHTHNFRVPDRPPLIYEVHIGMAQETPAIGSYDAFREHILPRVIAAGYNTLQMMAVMEHPYYGSFGYQVSSFFAASSRFGPPEALKALIDAAHAAGLSVIMDLVHSHAVRNEREGLSRFDGSEHQYFHAGSRGWHEAWDSRCFDYGRIEVLHFLLSNCRFWLDEFRFDGFRFDGVTSMLYLHHGLGIDFADYRQYYDDMVDEDAYVYLSLANRLIHEVRPDALTVAEDVSGMPGLAQSLDQGGVGFDYRMAMGVPECWFKHVQTVQDEDWNMGVLWHELTNRREDERTLSYVESHDQALVGGKTLLFSLMDAAIYDAMHRKVLNVVTDRAIALHKMIRLVTVATAGNGYLNFMGNEFGHPEWIDFPREGNGYSFAYARRLWSLRDDPDLYYGCLAAFDRAMLDLFGHPTILGSRVPRAILLSDSLKILGLSRGPLTAVFNFHPETSVTDCCVPLPPGRYDRVLDTDALRFGGQGRIAEHQCFLTHSSIRGNVRDDEIRIYLPARTALVVRRVE